MDSRLIKGEDVVVRVPGAMIEHVMNRIEHVMGADKGGYSKETMESSQEDEASKNWAGHSVRDSTRDRSIG